MDLRGGEIKGIIGGWWRFCVGAVDRDGLNAAGRHSKSILKRDCDHQRLASVGIAINSVK
jgi:hypothetical protein